MLTDRFAPSPTGALHLGHAFSALLGHDAARAAGGRYLLRMEDLDRGRVRPGCAEAICRDLAWIGIHWDGPVLAQSTRRPAYEAALDRLGRAGLTYACACSRKDIAEAAAAPHGGAHGPDGVRYPGTCRTKGLAPGPGLAMRLDMASAISALGGTQAVASLGFTELGAGPHAESGRITLDPAWLVEVAGDPVLARRDGTPAYHLAVVVDDAAQGVSMVTRGEDLFAATAIHRLLQALLDLPVPSYRHHKLICDEAGRRLAKRDDARALSSLREGGATPADVRAMMGLD